MNKDGKNERPITKIEKPWSIRSELFEFLSMFVMVPIMLAIVTIIIIDVSSESLSFAISLVIGLLFALPFSYLVIGAFRLSLKQWRPQRIHLNNESITLFSGKNDEITIQFGHTTRINVGLHESLVDPLPNDIDYHKIIDEIHDKGMPRVITGIFIENNEHKIGIGILLGWSREDLETIWRPLLRTIKIHEVGIGSNLQQVLKRSEDS